MSHSVTVKIANCGVVRHCF